MGAGALTSLIYVLSIKMHTPLTGFMISAISCVRTGSVFKTVAQLTQPERSMDWLSDRDCRYGSFAVNTSEIFFKASSSSDLLFEIISSAGIVLLSASGGVYPQMFLQRTGEPSSLTEPAGQVLLFSLSGSWYKQRTAVKAYEFHYRCIPGPGYYSFAAGR